MSVKISNETKTGLFVVICLAVLGGLLLKVGHFNLFKEGYIIKSHFHFTGGVKKNAPVRLSGVDVGEVKNIRVLYGDDMQVEVDLWLYEGTKVRLDSHAYITTLGMMGEKYIEIKAGTPGAAFAQAGESIPGDDPVRLEELIEVGTKVANDVGQMAKDISKVANHVDDTIQGNRSKIDNIFNNLEETSENFNDFSQDVKYHPWKVLMKGKEVSKQEIENERAIRRAQKGKTTPVQASVAESGPAGVPSPAAELKKNFGPGKK